MDYNDVLKHCWYHLGQHLLFQTNCLKPPPEGNGIWNLALPPANIDRDSVVLLHCQDFLNYDHTGVRELNLIDQHFGDRARQVVVVTWEIDMGERYTGNLNLAYFPTHTYNIIKNMIQCQDLWKPQLLNQRSKRYQCLNGIGRPHRVDVVQLLDQLDLPNFTSLGPERQLPLWPYYPNYFNCENEHNYLKLLYVYGDCDINVVTETVYDERPGIITEKTLFALMSLQVPLLIGYPGMVAHVRDLGFDVFEDIIDISYDSMPNDHRLIEAIRRNETVLRVGINRSMLQTRLQRNQDLVLSWPQRMIKNYQQRCGEIQDLLSKT